jgi:hypothetical protein
MRMSRATAAITALSFAAVAAVAAAVWVEAAFWPEEH